jgi:hypothetical protein
VRNSRPWADVRNVEVFVVTIQTLRHDDTWQVIGSSNPVPMKWQYEYFHAYQAYQPMGRERFCDLGRIDRTRGFSLQTRFSPDDLSGELKKAGRFRATFIARAGGSESPPLTVEVAWDGNWDDSDSEMAKHLVIQAVQS